MLSAILAVEDYDGCMIAELPTRPAGVICSCYNKWVGTSACRSRASGLHQGCGEMAEWLKAHAWKACIGETLSRVRIPVSPPVTGSELDCFQLPCGDYAPRLREF